MFQGETRAGKPSKIEKNVFMKDIGPLSGMTQALPADIYIPNPALSPPQQPQPGSSSFLHATQPDAACHRSHLERMQMKSWMIVPPPFGTHEERADGSLLLVCCPEVLMPLPSEYLFQPLNGTPCVRETVSEWSQHCHHFFKSQNVALKLVDVPQCVLLRHGLSACDNNIIV